MSGTGLIAVTYDVHCRDHTASPWGECANRECILAYECQIEIAELKTSYQTVLNMYQVLSVQVGSLRGYEQMLPCGHWGRYQVDGKEGTSFCLMCEFVAQKHDTPQLKGR